MDAGTWFTQLNAWQVMLLGLVFFGGIYLLGGLLMSTLTSVLSRLGIGQVLDTRPLKPDQLGREWRQSFHSILVFGLGMIVPWGFLQLGWAHLTPDASAGRIALEIAVLLIWNDVHFWINHRLLHTRKLVRYHGDHHRSVVTTPWSTYSFHPIEALMLGNIILLPLAYRLGYQKARYAYYLCIGLLASFMGYFVSSGDSAFESILPAHGSLLVLVVVLAAALALYALSWRLSVAWYGKAEQ